MLSDRLEHLPDIKHRELERVLKVLFDEFEAAAKGKSSDKRNGGRILKVILFGSYARGDWVEDRASGYLSDYDLLIVVNREEFTDVNDYWSRAEEHFTKDFFVTKQIRTPVNFIVHTLEDVNDKLALGRPFFSDIAREGVALYEVEGYPLTQPKPLAVEDVRAEARLHFDHWMPKATEFEAGTQFYINRGNRNVAAFLLHQAAEALYHCLLLTVTLYAPKSHNLVFLRSQTKHLDPRLREIWPDDTRLAKRAFARLQRAYVDARYSPKYVITDEELTWLVERVRRLETVVKEICMIRLGE